MARTLTTPQTIVLVAAALSLACACGIPIGPQNHYPPPSIKRSLLVTSGYLSFVTKVGSTSDPLAILVKNISGRPVELDQPTLYSIHNGEAFHLTTTCKSTLAAGETCYLTLTFSPPKQSSSEARLLFSAKPAESYGLIVRGTARKP